MTTRICYVDEAHDSEKFCLTALIIRHQDWHESFRMIRQQRMQLKNEHGLFLRKEIHAHKFVSGRGRMSKTSIGKWQRSRIFLEVLHLIASLPNVELINVCLDKAGRKDPQLDAWDRLLNRIERSLVELERRELPRRKQIVSNIQGLSRSDLLFVKTRLESYAPKAIIFADEGREREITRAFRKMHIFNPVPSQYGSWGNRANSKNIPLARLIEDPAFKRSDESYFLQLVDCAVFSLLKREVSPTPNIRRYKIDQMFDAALTGVCNLKASKDKLGIVRK